MYTNRTGLNLMIVQILVEANIVFIYIVININQFSTDIVNVLLTININQFTILILYINVCHFCVSFNRRDSTIPLDHTILFYFIIYIDVQKMIFIFFCKNYYDNLFLFSFLTLQLTCNEKRMHVITAWYGCNLG